MTAPDQKSMLFISIDFPPARTSGIYRPVFFTKYLIEKGWKITLLTSAEHLSTVQDTSLYTEIHSELRVIRASAPMPRKFTERIYKGYKNAAGMSGQDETPGAQSSPKAGFLKFIKKFILSPGFRLLDNILLIPDNYIIWCFKNLFKAYRIIKKEKVTHLLVTSPPPSVLMFGLMLNFLTRVIFVTDFRNSWTDNQPYKLKFRGALERFWERRVIKKSRAIINMSPGDVTRLLARMPDVPREKLSVVTNGYNEADWVNYVGPGKPTVEGPLRLVYVGSMYPHSGDSTAGALKILTDRGYTSLDFELSIIGFSDESFDKLAARYKIGRLIKNIGFMTHDDLIRAYPQFDILYLLTGGTAYYHTGALPGKIFEYMRAGKPILHAGIEGTTHDILAESGQEIFAPLDKPDAIAQAMIDLLNQKKSGAFEIKPDLDFARRYEWKNLAAHVDRIITEIE